MRLIRPRDQTELFCNVDRVFRNGVLGSHGTNFYVESSYLLELLSAFVSKAELANYLH